MKKTWMPIVAGILDIISAPFVLILALGPALQGHILLAQLLSWSITIAGVVAFVGGVFALRRRVWGLALAGSICASPALCYFWLGRLSGMMWLSLILAGLWVPAILLIVLAKGEFK